MERYPWISKGSIQGFQVSGGDFTAVFDSTGSRREVYFWVSIHEAKRIDSLLENGFLRLKNTSGGELVIDVERFLEDIPWPQVYFSRRGLKDYSSWVASKIGSAISGSRILVNFSGGKDSTAVLAVLSSLQEEMGLEIHAVYSHVPFIEPERNIDFALRAIEKLGATPILVEAPRKLFEKKLREEGLPYRGWRWCTYFKLKPVKEVRKKLSPDYTADGDRIAEAFKRYKRLISMSPRRPRLLSGTRIKPIYILTILDIARIVRETKLVHPDYLKGFPRVACHYCPYIVPHELELVDLEELEDSGVVEEAIKASYRRDYRDAGIPWEDFLERALWRHHPKPARIILEAAKRLEKRKDLEVLDARKVNERYRSLWVDPLPSLPEEDPEKATEAFRETVGVAFEYLKNHIREESAWITPSRNDG